MIRREAMAGIVILFLSLSILAAARQTERSNPSTKAIAAIVTITDQDNGKNLNLTTNQTLLVELKSNPTTGYSWAISGESAPLKLEESAFRSGTNSSQVAGAPGWQIFRLRAASVGTAKLTLIYRRAWEHNQPPAQTFSVNVNVR